MTQPQDRGSAEQGRRRWAGRAGGGAVAAGGAAAAKSGLLVKLLLGLKGLALLGAVAAAIGGGGGHLRARGPGGRRRGLVCRTGAQPHHGFAVVAGSGLHRLLSESVQPAADA